MFQISILDDVLPSATKSEFRRFRQVIAPSQKHYLLYNSHIDVLALTVSSGLFNYQNFI